MRTTHRRRRPVVRMLIGFAALLAALAVPAAPAQQPDGGVVLHPEPLGVPSLGLRLHLPEGSLVDSSALANAKTSVRVQAEDQTWVLQVHNSRSSNIELTTGDVLDSIIEQRQGAEMTRHPRTGKPLRVKAFDRSDTVDLGLETGPAGRVYLRVAEDPTGLITGYTVVPRGAGSFVIFQIDAPAASFEQARRVFETVVAAAEFRDPGEINADRLVAIEAGQRMLAALNSAELDAALMDEPLFLRIFEPGSTGSTTDDREIGYQRVQLRAGFAGELNARKNRNQWNSAERQPGYIAQVDAKILHGDHIIESQSIFFLSDDRTSETWSITQIVRQGVRKAVQTMTVIRRDDRLTVKVEATAQPPIEKEYALPKGYISKVEQYLLPRLVVAQDLPNIFGFYHLEPATNRITFRRDTFDKLDSGGWKHTETRSENAAPMVTILNPDGSIRSRTLDTGDRCEPIARERLRQIWRNKSLPIGG